MELLLLLLTAHFIGDFYLQPASWVNCRNTNHLASKGLWKHIAVHTLLNIIVVSLSATAFIQGFVIVMAITISHLITDQWKSHRANNLSYFLIDQAIHILIITMLWLYFSVFTAEQITQFLSQAIRSEHLIIAAAYLLIGKPASVIIALALKKHTDALFNNPNSEQSVGLESAGAWIGYIERALAVSFIFMEQFAGIGFLVAAKTIFRFGDLTKNHDMKLTEYMMLGTLLSYAIAIFVGWNALLLHQSL